jgi:hypothetical protein
MAKTETELLPRFCGGEEDVKERTGESCARLLWLSGMEIWLGLSPNLYRGKHGLAAFSLSATNHSPWLHEVFGTAYLD